LALVSGDSNEEAAMLNPAVDMAWVEAAVILALLVGAGFVASWLATDVLRMSRALYVGVLATVTIGATAATAWGADVSVWRLASHHWQAGVLGGMVTGLVVGAAIRKLPAKLRRTGRDLRTAEAWEGIVYGITEGVLLSGLPVFVAWTVATDRGSSAPASWAIALAASATMIAVHHFGYWDFRGRQVLPAIAACLLLSAAYLVTGSLVAPALGHVIMHLAGITKGVELPPHARESVAAA
jgi:hypothetical protein